ncbi:MAG: acetylglutamate kinase [Sandaracinaceae bacterium]
MTPQRSSPIRVLKVGGARLDEPDFVRRLAEHIGSLVRRERIVLVHGGGPQIGALHDALGLDHAKLHGVRVTSERSMPVVAMALARVNLAIVNALGTAGVRSLGLSGLDARLMRSDLLDAARWGRVGDAPRVHRSTLLHLLELAPVVVLSPVCLGPDHAPVNVNADTVAQAVARSLRCHVFDLMTDVDGVLDDEGRLVPALDPERAKGLVHDGVAAGGMAPKLLAASTAVRDGVARVRIGTLESIERGRCTEVRAGAAGEGS